MKKISLEELQVIEEMETVERVEFNGVSGIDGKSNWYTVYYTDGKEEDVYTYTEE